MSEIRELVCPDTGEVNMLKKKDVDADITLHVSYFERLEAGEPVGYLVFRAGVFTLVARDKDRAEYKAAIYELAVQADYNKVLIRNDVPDSLRWLILLDTGNDEPDEQTLRLWESKHYAARRKACFTDEPDSLSLALADLLMQESDKPNFL